jgi:hypothetical protein
MYLIKCEKRMVSFQMEHSNTFVFSTKEQRDEAIPVICRCSGIKEEDLVKGQLINQHGVRWEVNA